MIDLLKYLIGFGVLLLAVPLGDWIRKLSYDEIVPGQKWFRLLMYLGLVGGLVGLALRNDWVMFFSLFVALFSSRSVIVKKAVKKTKKVSRRKKSK